MDKARGEWKFGIMQDSGQWYAYAHYSTDELDCRDLYWSYRTTEAAAKRDLARLRRMVKVR